MGYTPLFDSLTTGSLCGRWPDIGLWPLVLSLADARGTVDVTADYLARVSGLPVADVEACMARFCGPDPYSRTPEAGGARLQLIDEHRNWGWVVVNHGKYREKARKQMQQLQATQSGRDADRKRVERERNASSDVRRSPAKSSRVRLSDSDSDSDSDSRTKNTSAAARPAEPPEFAELKAIYPRRDGAQPWNRALKAIRARLAAGDTWQAILDGARRYAAHIRASGKEGTEFVMQAATFCGPDRHFAQPWTPTESPESPAARERAAIRQLCDRRTAIGLPDFRDPHEGETSAQYRAAQEAACREREQRTEQQRRPIPDVRALAAAKSITPGGSARGSR